MTGANAVLPQGGVGWVVSLDFDAEGARALADASTRLSALPECGIAGANPCNAFAIVLDGVVTSAPRFNEPILGGSAQIEGNFTAQEARDLANILKYGALPVTLEPVDITTVSPTVGNDQLRAGIIAGLLGLLLVAIYLVAYYRALGVVAVLSLLIAGVILYLTLIVMSKTIGLTLTLAGVAGAIVAIGITADSFIVYFERIRDEIREGRSLRQACDTGWVRARRTLLAADFVSILAAVVLYVLSVGSVRGFAFVLGLTTIIDVIVAFWFTHPLAVLLGRTRWMQGGSKWTGLDTARMGGHAATGAAPSTIQTAHHDEGGVLMSGLGSLGHRLYSGEVSYDFVGRKKTWYVVSAVIIVVAVGAILLRGLNLGIEFRGGADFSLPNATCSVEQARVTAETATGAQAIVTETASGTDPRADRVADAGGELRARGRARRHLRDPEVRGQGPGGRSDLGRGDLQEGAAGPGRLPPAGVGLPLDLLRVAHGRRGPRRAGARPPHHRRHLRPHRAGGHARDGHRPADHPRLLPVRHGRRVRQGEGEHARASSASR